jgi:hypothetical protein
MGRNKTAKEKRDRQTTIIFCKEHKIYEIVAVLTPHSNHVLWDKTKYEWSLENWMEYFELKQQHEQILKQLE